MHLPGYAQAFIHRHLYMGIYTRAFIHRHFMISSHGFTLHTHSGDLSIENRSLVY